MISVIVSKGWVEENFIEFNSILAQKLFHVVICTYYLLNLFIKKVDLKIFGNNKTALVIQIADCLNKKTVLQLVHLCPAGRNVIGYH